MTRYVLKRIGVLYSMGCGLCRALGMIGNMENLLFLKHAVDWTMDVCFHLIKSVDHGDTKDGPSSEHQWKNLSMGI
jgi:hypothetical protein